MQTESQIERDKALESLRRRNKDFIAAGIEYLLRGDIQHQIGPEFTGEVIKKILERHLVASSPHIWGVLTSVCLKKRIFERTGVWRPMETVSSHARLTPVYRWVNDEP